MAFQDTVRLHARKIAGVIAVSIFAFNVATTLSYGEALTVGEPTPVFTLTHAKTAFYVHGGSIMGFADITLDMLSAKQHEKHHPS